MTTDIPARLRDNDGLDVAMWSWYFGASLVFAVAAGFGFPALTEEADASFHWIAFLAGLVGGLVVNIPVIVFYVVLNKIFAHTLGTRIALTTPPAHASGGTGV